MLELGKNQCPLPQNIFFNIIFVFNFIPSDQSFLQFEAGLYLFSDFSKKNRRIEVKKDKKSKIGIKE